MLANTPSISTQEFTKPRCKVCKQKKKKELYQIVDRQISNLSLQQFTASARKHSGFLYPRFRKTSPQFVQVKKKKRTISNRPSSDFELKLTTIHCKCSQTHRVFLPKSSQNLAAICASKKKTELYQIVDRQISNLSLQQFTASARKHTEYLYPVVHKTSLQSVQTKKELYRIFHGQISNLSLQQFTASARKHSEYLYPVVHKTSLQSVPAKKKNYIESSMVKFRT